jgi:hypothetical protein
VTEFLQTYKELSFYSPIRTQKFFGEKRKINACHQGQHFGSQTPLLRIPDLHPENPKFVIPTHPVADISTNRKKFPLLLFK